VEEGAHERQSEIATRVSWAVGATGLSHVANNWPYELIDGIRNREQSGLDDCLGMIKMQLTVDSAGTFSRGFTAQKAPSKRVQVILK
jgi:hypothetical protein